MKTGNSLVDALNRLPGDVRMRVFREAGILQDIFPSLEPNFSGGYAPSELYEWAAKHSPRLTPLVLRAIDLPDFLVAGLVQEGGLPVEQPQGSATIRFAVNESNTDYPRSLRITDVAAASAFLSSLFVQIAAANMPLGIEVDGPPEGEVNAGSVQFAVSGGLFTSGMGLLVACSAGLVSSPVVGPIAGATLAALGVMDLALNWKQKVVELRKCDAERRVAEEERKLKEVEVKIKELELEKARLQYEGGGELSGRTELYVPAPSGFISRELVVHHAESLGVTESQANHILNRSLLAYKALKAGTPGWNIYIDAGEKRGS